MNKLYLKIILELKKKYLITNLYGSVLNIPSSLEKLKEQANQLEAELQISELFYVVMRTTSFIQQKKDR